MDALVEACEDMAEYTGKNSDNPMSRKWGKLADSIADILATNQDL